MGRPAAIRASLLVMALCTCALAAQAQSFRSGIDIVLVDLTVFDGRDRPIADLAPGDIELRVDGQLRPVRSLTFLSAPDARSGMQRPSPAAPAGLSPGELQRTIVLVVDRESIPSGQGQQALGAAAKFVDRLPAGDRVAFATMPEPGERLRFDEPRRELKERLGKAVGTWWPAPSGRTIFPWEAIEIDRGSKEVLDQVAQRECPGATATSPAAYANCRAQIAVEARIVADARKRDVQSGLDALARLFGALGSVEGPKHLVLLAGGIAESTESLHSIGSLASVAMANRVRVHVLQITPNAEWISPEQPGLPSRPVFAPPSTAVINLASATGGLAFAPVAGEAFFARLEKQLAGAYLLAFDPVAADRDGKRHRIDVRVPGRKGVSVRTRAEFIVPPSPTMTAASPAPSGAPAAASAGAPRNAAPTAAPTPAPIPTPQLQPTGDPTVLAAVRRMADYVGAYGASAALFVAAERYDQRIEAGPGALRPHTLESEFAIVRTRDAIGWAGYRDVVKVDGDQVADRRDRLQALLTGSTDPTAEVRRIADESARYNVGPVMRNFNLPTTALFFFHPARVGRFAFTSKGPKKVDGTPVVQLDFVEVARPTLVMKRDGTDVPVEGSVWVVPDDGTIVRTRVRLRGFADSVRMSDYDPHGGARHAPRSMDTQPAPGGQSSPGGRASTPTPGAAPSAGSGGATGGSGGGSSAASGSQSGTGSGASQGSGGGGQATTSGPERGAPERPRFDTFQFPDMDRIESRADVEVTFRRDPESGVWLPERMSEIYEGPIGTRKPVSARATALARYTGYRRFETSATMITPK